LSGVKKAEDVIPLLERLHPIKKVKVEKEITQGRGIKEMTVGNKNI
jgi:hypothetical protein